MPVSIDKNYLSRKAQFKIKFHAWLYKHAGAKFYDVPPRGLGKPRIKKGILSVGMKKVYFLILAFLGSLPFLFIGLHTLPFFIGSLFAFFCLYYWGFFQAIYEKDYLIDALNGIDSSSRLKDPNIFYQNTFISRLEAQLLIWSHLSKKEQCQDFSNHLNKTLVSSDAQAKPSIKNERF